jgi:hypothetical protein
MAPFERDPSAMDPRNQGSGVFSFIAVFAIIVAAFVAVYLYSTSVPQPGPSVALSEPAAPTPTTSPSAPPAAVPNPNPPPEPAPGQTVPDQGKADGPGQPAPPGTGN